jgi:ATP-binding cassette subfamily B protein
MSDRTDQAWRWTIPACHNLSAGTQQSLLKNQLSICFSVDNLLNMPQYNNHKMPQGYQTVIDENSETLSGGEHQRVSIARALLKDAPVVLLDEATASLDVENETKTQAGISALIRGETVIIIAHRMRTVANADRIVVLENGRITETDSPEELKKQNRIFARMVERQMGKDIPQELII